MFLFTSIYLCIVELVLEMHEIFATVS